MPQTDTTQTYTAGLAAALAAIRALPPARGGTAQWRQGQARALQRAADAVAALLAEAELGDALAARVATQGPGSVA